LKEGRKIIQYRGSRKQKIQQFLEHDNKPNGSSIIRDVKSIVFDISSRYYLLKEKPEQLVNHIDIKICRHDEVQDKDIQVGEALAFFINGDIALEVGSLSKVMSSYSQTLSDLYSALFKKNNESVNRLDDYGAFGTNMLFIDYLVLYPKYRGYGLGRPIIMGIIEEISGGADVVLIEPVPIRFKNANKNVRLQLPSLSNEEHERARKKLSDYWKPLGFMPVGFMPVDRSGRFQVLPLSIMHPTAKELLNEISGIR